MIKIARLMKTQFVEAIISRYLCKYNAGVNMRIKKTINLLTLTISIITISLPSSGGCGINFGGGGGGTTSGSVQGTVTSINNGSSISGITVQATDAANIFTTTTGSNGFFLINANFTGSSLLIEFLDGSQNPPTNLGIININIFPGAGLNLGNITITNGIVTLGDGIIATFDGSITQNNCSGNSGTITVTSDNTNVIAQIASTTSLVDNNSQQITCARLVPGATVNVMGTLLMGNTVSATRVQLQ
jgi:hypothetical protein